ncbi:transglycosylase SLT domain-containing protein [Spartinivicinus ruber]|uniref:transglycosylase SLT domain-containing protein n=1 Tax=Spartinivicinus ruber TaxID=2683272 RepID=UPI0013D57979|nr:transglycosylase SLT domain-containing protein [Spartinivicinus ruber]
MKNIYCYCLILLGCAFASSCKLLPEKQIEKRLYDDTQALLEFQLMDGEIASWVDKAQPGIERNLAIFLTHRYRGKLCRDYYTVVIDHGHRQPKVYGTTCRLSDGQWQQVRWSNSTGSSSSSRKAKRRYQSLKQLGKQLQYPRYSSKYNLPSRLAKASQRAEKKYRLPLRQYIDKAAKRNNLSPVLVHAVVKTESNYNPRAVSHVGAKGLMQLMPATAKEVGVNNPFNARQNVHGGSRYLKKMLTRPGINGNVALALAAYNAGYGNVRRYGYKVPPYRETKAYVKRIVGLIHSS